MHEAVRLVREHVRNMPPPRAKKGRKQANGGGE